VITTDNILADLTLPYSILPSVLWPSVLWYCWLGIRNSIRPVKFEWWGVGVVICVQQGADCLRMVQLTPLHPKTPSPLASCKSRLVLPFWYRITKADLEKRLLNGCCSSSSSYTIFTTLAWCIMQRSEYKPSKHVTHSSLNNIPITEKQKM